ncbi:MAG TPA: VOC family protein [Solirubrobacteraceae bacterium]|nr:VOC family protein [Solirubrobacteraceae bacterium]
MEILLEHELVERPPVIVTQGRPKGTMSSHAHHAIDYIEISVTDVEAAKAFYASAFGWSFADYGPDYAGIEGDGKEMGGLRRESEVRPGGPLVILYSDDLEASAEAVTSAGGTLVEPITAFPGGRRFHFADPSGNELAVWSARPSPL